MGQAAIYNINLNRFEVLTTDSIESYEDLKEYDITCAYSKGIVRFIFLGRL